MKSNMQVHGKNGINVLKYNIRSHGFRSLYNGAMASYSATVIGHFPWFYTYNILQEKIPNPRNKDKFLTFMRSGTIGFCSSNLCSDIVSNSVRVLKIGKQTGDNKTYTQVVKQIIEKESIVGLFTRGLKTKLLINGIQGFIFVVVFDKFKKLIS